MLFEVDQQLSTRCRRSKRGGYCFRSSVDNDSAKAIEDMPRVIIKKSLLILEFVCYIGYI